MNAQQDLFENVAKFVQDSKTLIAKGAMVEMAGLDKQVHSLCEQILQLSQEDRLKYADMLQDLLTQLKILGEDLVRQREALAHEIRYLSSHKKASVAYKTADSKAELVSEKIED
jgi:hypothetical protein